MMTPSYALYLIPEDKGVPQGHGALQSQGKMGFEPLIQFNGKVLVEQKNNCTVLC
jgi:hypothetical protein